MVSEMAEEIPQQVRNQVIQLQQLQQQAQTLTNQKARVEVMLREVNMALEELENLDKDSTIYQSVGGLLIKSEKSKVKENLSERKENLDLRSKMLEKQEKRVQERLGQLQQSLQSALAGGATGPSS